MFFSDLLDFLDKSSIISAEIDVIVILRQGHYPLSFIYSMLLLLELNLHPILHNKFSKIVLEGKILF